MTGAPQPRVTVVVATRDRWDDLRETLPRHRPHPVVLVDNGSRDGTPERVAEAFPEVEIVRLESNAGAAARNEGVRRAPTPYVAFADDDSWWEPGALDRAADVLDADGRLALVAARVLVGESGRLDPVCAQMEASALGTHASEPGPRVLGFIACGAVVRRSAFLAVDGFDSVVFFAGEEERLALDLADAGWSLCYVSGVVARHVPSPVRDAAGRASLITRNRLLTAVLRRPAGVVVRETLDAARSREGRRGVAAAVPRLPSALRCRRRLSPQIEAARRLLDATDRAGTRAGGSGQPGSPTASAPS